MNVRIEMTPIPSTSLHTLALAMHFLTLSVFSLYEHDISMNLNNGTAGLNLRPV